MNVSATTVNGFETDKHRRMQQHSINREMKSHQMNSAQDKLLELSNSRLDKIINKESRSSRHVARELEQEQQNIQKCTPPAEVWLRQHEAQYQAWKDREREKLLKKHKSMIKSYRLPTDDSCDKNLKLVRSKTFMARDKSPKDSQRRLSVASRTSVDVSEPAVVSPRRRPSRRYTVSFSDVSSRRSSVDSM